MNRAVSPTGYGQKTKRQKWFFLYSGRWLFIAPAVFYLLAMFVYPMFYNVDMSLRNYTISSIATGEAPFIGLQNYVELFSMPLMWGIFQNTVLFVVGSIVFQVIIGMSLALFFTKKFPLNDIIRALLLIPWLLPLIVSGTAFNWIFNKSHGILNWALLQMNIIDQPVGWLISTDLSLPSVIAANIWVGIPFCMVLFYNGLQNVPAELYEAGKIDGCNPWQSFWYITVPYIREVIAIVLMLALIYTLKVFDMIVIMTGGGPANSSQILSTWSYDLSFTQFSFGLGTAVANIMVLISLIFSIFYLRMSRE